jgi:hypothetical protein
MSGVARVMARRWSQGFDCWGVGKSDLTTGVCVYSDHLFSRFKLNFETFLSLYQKGDAKFPFIRRVTYFPLLSSS